MGTLFVLALSYSLSAQTGTGKPVGVTVPVPPTELPEAPAGDTAKAETEEEPEAEEIVDFCNVTFAEADTLREQYSVKDKEFHTHQLPIEIAYYGDTSAFTDVIINISIRHITTSEGDVRLLNTSLVIPKSESLANKKSTQLVFIEIAADAVEEGVESFDIILSSRVPGVVIEEANSRHAFSIIDATPPFEPDSPFRISLGANFDFIEKVQANSFYAHVNFFKPDIFGEKKRFGTNTGIIQNKYLSTTEDYPQIIYTPVSQLNGDSSRFVRQRYRGTQTSTYNNINLYCGSLFTIVQPKLSDGQSATWFGHMEVEAVYRKIAVVNTLDSLIQTDTVALPNFYGSLYSPKFTFTVVDYYFGGTIFDLQFKNKEGQLWLKSSVGLHWRTGDKMNFYYLAQFNLLETKAGVNFGGEVRGEFGVTSSPNVGIYLSKAFNVDKLLDF